jgi:imidazole glycerol-phosphate synthase subunit HisH
MEICILQYNAGNVFSVASALDRLGAQYAITDNHEAILSADKVIFPGVGEASTAMSYLREKQLDLLIPQLKQPVLGICLGMQIMCKHSEEGNTECLGIFDNAVLKFKSEQQKIPHMGWNHLNALQSPLFKDIIDEYFVYFVHSYYAELSKDTVAQSDYILPFSAALQKNNFYGVQFHPEKSSKTGSQIIQNFLNL